MFTPEILRFESLPSTNLEAARRAMEGAPEGLCVVAGEQTAGRGRLQRHWVSPKGAGLYFSIVLRPRFEQSAWPLITLMAAVSVHDALLSACALESDIKWPNDILVNEKKLCGILAETVDARAGRSVVVGIGINLTKHSLPAELQAEATSVEAANGGAPNLETLLTALIETLGKFYQQLTLPDGSQSIIREWCARSSYAQDKVVRVVDNNESVTGTTRGLENDGSLRVETEDGQIKTIRTGDVTIVRATG